MKIAAAACAALILGAALPAFAEDKPPMPKMFRSMEKGQWRTEILEHSQMKPGQKMPAMTMCTDNFMKQAQEHQPAKSERECKHRLLKDGADDMVWEIACPKRTVTTTMKRESSKAMLADIRSTGDQMTTIKMRYTYLGPCREGQTGISYDKNSEQCKKIQQSAAKMDPAKSCAGAGDQRAQCEQMLRGQIAQMKAMCN